MASDKLSPTQQAALDFLARKEQRWADHIGNPEYRRRGYYDDGIRGVRWGGDRTLRVGPHWDDSADAISISVATMAALIRRGLLEYDPAITRPKPFALQRIYAYRLSDAAWKRIGKPRPAALADQRRWQIGTIIKSPATGRLYRVDGSQFDYLRGLMLYKLHGVFNEEQIAPADALEGFEIFEGDDLL